MMIIHADGSDAGGVDGGGLWWGLTLLSIDDVITSSLT